MREPPSIPAPPVIERLRVRFRGAVQGVGFRPFLHKMATRHGISGFVLNDPDGVAAELEGGSLQTFLALLRLELPPLARIDAMEVTQLPPLRHKGFHIYQSGDAGTGTAQIGPDAAACPSCLDEMFERRSRFYLYPFVTCTDCGPRFTISKNLPYDRPATSMAGFAMCPDCAADYADPASRRFHAETIACPLCGPQLSHSIPDIAQALCNGSIVALKGIGGFHLLCDAANDGAVVMLRQRKQRPQKPFAVMVTNADSAERIAFITQTERALLQTAARPIVILRTRGMLAPSVAPALNRVGVMLASAPVHHLLFHALACAPSQNGTLAAVLVATSANAQGSPLVIDDADARNALRGIADLIVTHTRPILARADDSVMSVVDGAPFFIRRAGGFVPEPIDLGDDGPPVLAVGGHLKATLCVTRGREAFVSQHVGDLQTPETVRSYHETAGRLLAMLNVTPDIVACDLHPDYRSTLFAESLGLPLVRIQHHAAHVAAVAAEHRLFRAGDGAVFGVALDGQGYGDDGTAWGGELVVLQHAAWWRCGHLLPLALPGGDLAAKEPWRMGVAALVALGRGAEADRLFPEMPVSGRLAAFLANGARTPATTSLGRLFDAAAALLGVCTHQSYEGQAAMELEALADSPQTLDGGFSIQNHILDFRPLLAALLAPGITPCAGSALFHGTLAAGLAAWIGCEAKALGLTIIFLGGGCLANRMLTEGLVTALRAQGLTPLLPRAMPANDGGLSLGQAAIARASLMARPGERRVGFMKEVAPARLAPGNGRPHWASPLRRPYSGCRGTV